MFCSPHSAALLRLHPIHNGITHALRSVSEPNSTTFPFSRKAVTSRLCLATQSARHRRLFSRCIGRDRFERRKATWHGKLGESTPVEQISIGITEGLARARICDLFASGVPSLHQPSQSPRPKRARPSIQRLHNITSDLIGLITTSPVCAKHTLPLASPSTPSTPALLTVVTIPRRFRPNRPTPFEKPLT